MRKIKFIYLFALLFATASCSKSDEAITVVPDDSEGKVIPLPEDAIPSENQSIEQTADAKIVFNKTIVSSSYLHFCQLKAQNCGSVSCLPTTYMMARAILDVNYPVSKDQLAIISKGMKLSCSDGTTITNAYAYVKTVLPNNVSNQAPKDREIAKADIKNALDKGKPVVMLIKITAKNKQGDYLPTSSANDGRYNHWVTIIGLKLTEKGTGSVLYYIDPLDASARIRSVDYSLFLDASKLASAYNAYNYLAIGLNK